MGDKMIIVEIIKSGANVAGKIRREGEIVLNPPEHVIKEANSGSSKRFRISDIETAEKAGRVNVFGSRHSIEEIFGPEKIATPTYEASETKADIMGQKGPGISTMGQGKPYPGIMTRRADDPEIAAEKAKEAEKDPDPEPEKEEKKSVSNKTEKKKAAKKKVVKKKTTKKKAAKKKSRGK